MVHFPAPGGLGGKVADIHLQHEGKEKGRKEHTFLEDKHLISKRWSTKSRNCGRCFPFFILFRLCQVSYSVVR